MKDYQTLIAVVVVCLTALVATCLFLDTEQSRLVIEWIGKGITGTAVIGAVAVAVFFLMAVL